MFLTGKRVFSKACSCTMCPEWWLTVAHRGSSISKFQSLHWHIGNPFFPINEKTASIHPYHPMGGDFLCGHLTFSWKHPNKNKCHKCHMAYAAYACSHVHHIHWAKEMSILCHGWGECSGITVLRVHGGGSWVSLTRVGCFTDEILS